MAQSYRNQFIDFQGKWIDKFFLIGKKAAVPRCFIEKVFLKILQYSQENTYARVSFLINLHAWGL